VTVSRGPSSNSGYNIVGLGGRVVPERFCLVSQVEDFAEQVLDVADVFVEFCLCELSGAAALRKIRAEQRVGRLRLNQSTVHGECPLVLLGPASLGG
jgi:hypothetical protein